MGFKCGIIGLPNVGKSTLFNALTESNKAEAANYPFATIEPNVGRVAVPDERLKILGEIGKSEKIIPSYMDFVDIAGLVQGASKGEGLGNKFLGHIREVDAIAHVVRCFEDENITHVSNTIDPLNDIETINTELQLADIETLDSDILVDLGIASSTYDQFTSDSSEFIPDTNFTKDESFFTQFMQKTLGGSLRFIFQPDKTDFSPDGFAICVLDQDSISFKQVAHNTYNVSLKILEVW